MRSCELALAVFLIGLSSLVSSAQGTTALNQQYTPPGNIQLIDGYTWTPGIGKDARVGKISDKSGFSINFDRSAVAGFHAGQFSTKDDISWLKHQELNGQQLDVALFKNGELVASFDNTSNFSAKPTSMDQLADFLLTIVTYAPKPTSPSETNLKVGAHKIRLLPGYANQPSEGIDSAPGTIKKTDGLSINYDIGRMASNQVENVYKLNPSNVIWKKQQDLNGKKFSMILLKDGRIIANFAEESANFSATPKNGEELTDFLLMILTY